MLNTKGHWAIKENSRSVSILWMGKVIAKISHNQIPPGEATADAEYIITACNVYDARERDGKL